MRIYTSTLRKKVELEPLQKNKIRMYVCGPTVYDEIHIGNGRTFLVFDVIRRYLIYRGYQVEFVQNLTDVDDKIINRAREEKTSVAELSERCAQAFITQMNRMNILAPDIRPRATKEIPAMIEMISALIQKGYAYEAAATAPASEDQADASSRSRDVYFSVRNCPSYGEISGRKLDELMLGARIEKNPAKRDPADFTLWKAAKPGEPSWDSPWGKGRPGWHSECAAMVHRYLGTPIDIHGGGSDLAFPHHENEAAQARCCWGEPLANNWLHSGMLRINGEKMSKSLGNFYTLKEVLDAHSPEALRLLLLQTHYRSPLDFSFERLEGSEKTLSKLASCVSNLKWQVQSRGVEQRVDSKTAALGEPKDFAFAEAISAAREEFLEQMDDDFNTAGALAAIFNLATSANTYLAQTSSEPLCALCLRAADTLVELLDVLGVELKAEEHSELPLELIDLAKAQASYEGNSPNEAASALLSSREEARAAKDWARADAIRDGIAALGLVIEDTATGTRLRSKKQEV